MFPFYERLQRSFKKETRRYYTLKVNLLSLAFPTRIRRRGRVDESGQVYSFCLDRNFPTISRSLRQGRHRSITRSTSRARRPPHSRLNLRSWILSYRSDGISWKIGTAKTKGQYAPIRDSLKMRVFFNAALFRLTSRKPRSLKKKMCLGRSRESNLARTFSL